MATFNSNLLVAGAFSPPLATASTSSTGVTYVSGANVPFQTVDVSFDTVGPTIQGFAYNSITVVANAATAFTTRNLVSIPFAATTVWIPKTLHGTEMAVILKPVDNVQRSVLFTFLSAPAESAFASVSAFSTDVMGPDARRKWLYGYI